jgi:hypothetical protein
MPRWLCSEAAPDDAHQREDTNMSTRACYTFIDERSTLHVYKHHDGYPSGAVQWTEAALPLAWPLPRFEADEFAASFVAANKTSQGGVRLMPSGDIETIKPSDIAYRYEITLKDGDLFTVAYRAGWNKASVEIWAGPFANMAVWAKQFEATD